MHRFRFILVIFAVIGFFSYLSFNLYRLQIEKGDYYSNKAQAQFQLAGILQARRGTIFLTDKNNSAIPVAMEKPYPVVFAVPSEIKAPIDTAQLLAPILDMEKQKLQKVLEKNNQYELLFKKASDEQVIKVRALGLKGIYIDNQEFRFYPFEKLAANILGFVGPSDQGSVLVGKYGLEYFYEDRLAGKPGFMKDKKITPATAGVDFQLTIDRDIQTRAEEVIESLVKNFNAVRASVIVQEPTTGRILAMANTPSFDPNNYSKAKLADFTNINVQEIYEPGSVFKVLTMAAGIDSGAVTPETTYYDNGSLKVLDRIIKNWDLKAHGTVTMTEVIEKSLNTGVAFVEKKTGHENFYKYVLKFGFGKPTEIDLPGELTGNLGNLTGFQNPVHFATASFGQGISVTPIQLISAVATIANRGYRMRPQILANQEPEELGQVISEEAATKVMTMMESALEKAEVGKIDKYRLAGKTGTAQVPDFKHGGYTKDVINTYVGFGPVSKPRFIILIKLDKPEGAPLAGQTVVPAFRELAQFILNYYNIPPDNL